jgi:hypothetical protein
MPSGEQVRGSSWLLRRDAGNFLKMEAVTLVHGVISQMIVLFLVTARRLSDLTSMPSSRYLHLLLLFFSLIQFYKSEGRYPNLFTGTQTLVVLGWGIFFGIRFADATAGCQPVGTSLSSPTARDKRRRTQSSLTFYVNNMYFVCHRVYEYNNAPIEETVVIKFGIPILPST